MLNDGAEECIATLDGEQMAIEAIFRIHGDDGDWLYWFQLHGGRAGTITGDHAIDRDHVAFSQECKVPGHVTSEPLVLLLPTPLREAVVRWVDGAAEEPGSTSG